jgi:hypothetical protein
LDALSRILDSFSDPALSLTAKQAALSIKKRNRKLALNTSSDVKLTDLILEVLMNKYA